MEVHPGPVSAPYTTPDPIQQCMAGLAVSLSVSINSTARTLSIYQRAFMHACMPDHQPHVLPCHEQVEGSTMAQKEEVVAKYSSSYGRSMMGRLLDSPDGGLQMVRHPHWLLEYYLVHIAGGVRNVGRSQPRQ